MKGDWMKRVGAWLRATKVVCGPGMGLILALSGCTATQNPTTNTARLLLEARNAGLPQEDPLALDDEIKAAIEKAIRRSYDPKERLKLLRNYMSEGGAFNFQYTVNRTLTAREVWRERSGDCMSYTNLFVALARHLGLPTYFVHVREVSDYYERDGEFFVSSHVAAGYGSGPEALVIDLSKEMTDWKLASYRAIDDGAALALYYNNVAVDWMLSNRIDDAERLFRFWLSKEPGLAELHNNFGVLLNRQRRYQEALNVLRGAMESFPSFKPLYTNGLLAARQANKPELVRDFIRRGQELDRADPFFVFAHALSLYHNKSYAEAVREFERAQALKADSPVILAWLTRAYLHNGQRQEALSTFNKIKAISPQNAVLRDLEREMAKRD